MVAHSKPTPFVDPSLIQPSTFELPASERAAYLERKATLDQIMVGEESARHRIEVTFSSRHSGRRPTAGMLSWWSSGTKLHGGGDTKLYICGSSNPHVTTPGCERVIPDAALGSAHIICPYCGSVWRSEDLVGEIYYRLPIDLWADVLVKWWRVLRMDADVRVKYPRIDIRKAQQIEEERKLQGERLNRAREAENRISCIYPMKNIIKDTSNGAELRGRFLAFLKA